MSNRRSTTRTSHRRDIDRLKCPDCPSTIKTGSNEHGHYVDVHHASSCPRVPAHARAEGLTTYRIQPWPVTATVPLL